MSVPVSVNHVRKTLYPIFALAAVFGAQMFEYRVIILNYIHYIITWSIYSTIFCWLWFCSDFGIIFNNYTFLYVTFANTVTSLMATALTLQHRKRVLESLTIINNTFRVLDIPTESTKLETLMWRIIGMWCMAIVYVVFADASWMMAIFGKLVGSFVFVIVNYPFFVNTITYIIICLMLLYTESRFELLNKHIEKLMSQKVTSTHWSTEETYGVAGQLNPISISKRKHDIWTLMHVHTELCRICRDLNTIFGVQITFEIGTYFVHVCGATVFFCELYMVKSLIATTLNLSAHLLFRLFMICSWVCIYIGRLIYFNYICEIASAQARKTEKLIHDFLNCAKDFQQQQEIRQFILYMINKPLRFYGAGLFCFGYEFIHKFFGGIITVVLIRMQVGSLNETSTFQMFASHANVLTPPTDEIVPLNSSLLEDVFDSSNLTNGMHY